MKRNVMVVIFSILLSGSLFSQILNINNNQTFGAEKEDLYNNGSDKSMGFWVLPFSGATSGWAIPGNIWRYQRAQYIVRANEIETNGFPSGSTIDAIGFSISRAGNDSQTGSLKIYLKNTTDETYALGTGWTIDDFTLVCDIASWTVPIEIGPYIIEFSGGSSFTYNGGGVYVAYEFSNPTGPVGSGTIHDGAVAARCNNVLPGSFRGSRENNAMPTSLTLSSMRPQTLFVNSSLVDIAEINNIYTLEKVAVDYNPTPIDVRVTNVSSAPATFDVIVTVKDITNTTTYYTSTQTVTDLGAGVSTFVNFAGWNPTEIGDAIVYAETSEIPGENWLSNNTLSKTVNVNNNTLSYTYDNTNPAPAAFGFNHPSSGIFASKYYMNQSQSVTGANIVIANHTGNPGNTVFAVVMNSAGVILSQSDNYVIQASDLGTTKSFTFPSPPSFTNEEFFIGLAQTSGSATWRPLGRFTENPQRENTFYTAAITGGTLEDVPTSFGLKFGIEAIIGSPASCLAPTAVSATDITETSANLTWTPNGDATVWEYVYGLAPLSAPTGSGTVTSNTTNPISGLTNSTNYQFYVRTNCGEGSFSNWAGPYSFTTLCPLATLPFTETFQSAFFPPICWSSVSGSGSWTRSADAGGYGQSTASAKADFYNINGTAPFHLITLEFTTDEMSVPELSFDYAYAAYQTKVDNLYIYNSIDGGANWNLLLNMTGGPDGTMNTGGTIGTPFVPTASQWATKTINLPVGSNKVRFTAVSDYGNNLYIDNVTVFDGSVSVIDIAEINNIYTLEKVAVDYNPTPIDVRVTNVSSAPATFDVIVTVKDITNTTTYYTSSQTVTNLGAGVSTLVNFTGWNPTEIGDAIVYAETSEIPGENWLSNNSLNKTVNVNNNTLSHNYDNTNPAPTAFGFNHPGSGIFASKYIMNQTQSVTGANIVIANSALNPGNTVYAVVMNSAGVILSQSGNYVIQASDLGTTKSFTFPSPPSFTNEAFYIGMVQIAGSQTYYPLGVFAENPPRQNTFYTAPITGGTLSELPGSFKIKFGLEAIIVSPSSCLAPTAVSATDITETSANLTWTPNGSATGWEYVYGLAPLSAPTGSGTLTSSTTNPISGLEHNTSYQFFVRSVCAVDSYSEWAGPHTFATCAAVNAGYNNEICGNSTTLGANEPEAGNSGTWTIISGLATITNPALYNSTVTDAAYGEVTFRWTIDNGSSQCYDDVTITFIENPKADFSFEKNDLAVTFTNNSENATSYLWDFGDGNNSTVENPIHTYASVGNYTVVLTAHNGICEDEFSGGVLINVGISDVSEGKIIIYPNPTSGIINLSGKNLTIQNIEITDISGKTIFNSKNLNLDSKFEIDITNHPSGVYFLIIKTNDVVFTEKIIKN